MIAADGCGTPFNSILTAYEHGADAENFTKETKSIFETPTPCPLIPHFQWRKS